MKQVININFHGQVVPIEVSAFELLKNYTESLARFFANEEGRDEIINDIESRIGELFQERLKKGATCITDNDVNAIIKNMGRPEEFDGEEEKLASGLGSSAKEKYTQADQYTGVQKRLYRDENNKVLGGVCGGLANYLGTDPVIIRVLFVVVALFFGTGVLAYIIMWVAIPSSATKEIGGYRKKLFRDSDDKLIAGVCSGIGNYFGVSAWVPRILFLIPFLTIALHRGNWGDFDFPSFVDFSISPGSLIVYIIMWLVLPEATTTTEKLEMKGEKVDMNSIKNSVMEEMKGVQQRAGTFAKEAAEVVGDKGKLMGSDIKTAAKRSGRSLGDVIIILVKAFAYFVIGVVSIALISMLFALAIGAISVFPFKDFVLKDGTQNIFAWGTLLFFIAVPVIGVITWVIRRLAKMKSNRKVLRATFISLWVVGWICAMFLLASVSRDFKSVNNSYEAEAYLSNPSVTKLEITTNYPHRNRWFNGWVRLDEDTAYIRNIGIIVEKSLTDSFRVTIRKMANGNRKVYADTTAALITYNVKQIDSLLVLDKDFGFDRNTKFRNQGVIVTLYVPVGKQIRFDESIGRFEHVNIGFGEDGYIGFMDTDEEDYEKNTDFIMKPDGKLYYLNGKRADRGGYFYHSPDDNSDWNNEQNKEEQTNETGGSYRYYDNNRNTTIDSLKIKQEKDQQQVEDSLKKIQEQQQQMDSKKQTAQLNTKKGAATIGCYPAPLFFHL